MSEKQEVQYFMIEQTEIQKTTLNHLNFSYWGKIHLISICVYKAVSIS